MGKVLIIGAGGVGNVVAHKCAEHPEVFEQILLASRTLSKCEQIAQRIKNKYGLAIQTMQVDADKTNELIQLLQQHQPDLVINVALPYQDLSIMEACYQTKTHYLDTANYESKDVAKFEYKEQWAYHPKYQQAGITAVLGCGFDPGVTNMFCAYAQKHLFDEIQTIDILDCNAGEHGHTFATNFNPEINIREVTQVVRHWSEGKWIQTPPILDPNCVHFRFNYPEVGPRESYLLYHEEMESLVKHIKGLKRIRFWMTFSDQYLTYLRVLHDLGLTSIKPIDYEGQKIVPLKFLKTLLPDPASLGKNYQGKTVIGCVFTGIKNGQKIQKYIYNVCDHAKAYAETGAQAVSYTTGVPAMAGAMMILKKIWQGPGVFNVEQLDPDPCLQVIAQNGLPWQVTDFKGNLPD